MQNCLTGIVTNSGLVPWNKKPYDEGQTEGKVFNNGLSFAILVFPLSCNWEQSNAVPQSVFCS